MDWEDIYGPPLDGLVDDREILNELESFMNGTYYDSPHTDKSSKDNWILPENVSFEELCCSVPIIGIRRHRLLTDGNGVTTLVAFHGCPLSCKYCINPQCHEPEGILQFINPKQLYEHVKIDNIYFQSTGGGIVFGGGEPLLYADFINHFYEICYNDGWKLSVETSLNVNQNYLLDVISVIDEFIVDIKDMDSLTYKNYTGIGNENVVKNLELLKEYSMEEKVIIRIPLIPEYNNANSQNESIALLKEMGFSRFDKFYYTTSKEHVKTGDKTIGKAICEVLKNIRKTVADANNIFYNPEDCRHQGSCPGTCPKCEEELRILTEELLDRKSRGISINL